MHLEAVADVFRHIHGGEQRVVLEHETDVALFGAHLRHVRAVNENLALVCCLQTADDTKDRRLAAAGRPEQREKVPAFYIEADALEDLMVAEALF